MDVNEAINNLTINEFNRNYSPEASGWTATITITTPTGDIVSNFEKWGSDNYSHTSGGTTLGDEIDEAVWAILDEFADEYAGRIHNFQKALFEDLTGDAFGDIIDAAGYGG